MFWPTQGVGGRPSSIYYFVSNTFFATKIVSVYSFWFYPYTQTCVSTVHSVLYRVLWNKSQPKLLLGGMNPRPFQFQSNVSQTRPLPRLYLCCICTHLFHCCPTFKVTHFTKLYNYIQIMRSLQYYLLS